MDNNTDNNISEKKKSTKPIIITAVVIILVGVLAGSGFFAFNYIKQLKNEAENSTGIKTEPNVFFNDKDAEKYMADKVSSINVTMNQTVHCVKGDDGKLMAKVGLENKNDHQYIVRFFMADTGEDLYTTGLIPAGGVLETIPIDKKLAPGTYSVNAMFTVVSEKDNQTSLGSTGINTEMIVD